LASRFRTKSGDKIFWGYVDIPRIGHPLCGEADMNPCWEWLGTRNVRSGYGRFWDGRADSYAHRKSYFLFYGEEPGELDVLHSCDNPGCVNPAHLRLGTDLDNAQDKRERGRFRNQHSPPKEDQAIGMAMKDAKRELT
jgi:hypothetical protein